MEINRIKDEITEYLCNNFAIHITHDDQYDQHFFGTALRVSARDLVYLVNHLENKYGICFSKEDIDQKNLYTVNRLAACVCSKINTANSAENPVA